MRKLALILLFLSSLLAFAQTTGPAKEPASIPSPAPADCSADPKELVRLTAEHDILNDQRVRNYTYIEREETRHLKGDGSVNSTESETHEVLVLYGDPVSRMIAKNDQLLSEKDAKKEEEKIQKLMEKHQHESDEDRQKRLQKYDKEREEQRKFVREVTEVFTFTVLPEEQLEGRSACVFSIEPKPEYEPKEKEAKMLKKVHGRLWIDKQEQQWAKIDVQMIDTISFGLFLARLNKGSHLLIEQTRVNDEVWLPKHVSGTVEARLLLLKKLNLGFESTYKDYRKFRTVARMTSTGEEAPEKQ